MCEFWSKTFHDPTAFWTMITGLATILLIVVAWIQLGSLGKTSQGDFIFRLKTEFFTEKTRRLIFLIDNKFLKFVGDDPPHFKIEIPDKEKYRAVLEELGINQKSVSTYVVDDDLLGPLEDVGTLLEEKAIRENEVYNVFYTYVKACAEDEAILDYLRSQREMPGNEDVYDGFLWLNKRMTDYAMKSPSQPKIKLKPKSS